MLDVSALVHQMHDTLSQIHETITSLDTKKHDEKLDALEAQRDSVFQQLQAAFHKQREELEQKRKSERDEIAEKRRKEDEEVAARRKKEDDDLQNRAHSEDSEHEKKLEGEKKSIDDETDSKMEEIEAEAQRMLDEGHKKISELEQKRQDINRMIDEQMKAPLPPPPRRRRGTRSTPAQSAPAQQQPEQKEASREIAPQESAPIAEPQGESKEVVPETVPETKSTEEFGPESASKEEALPEKASQAESAPEETSAKDTIQGTQPEPVPENASKEDVSPEKAPQTDNASEETSARDAPQETQAETVPENAPKEEASSDKAPHADSVAEETSAKDAIQETHPEEPKQESRSLDQSAAQEVQPQETSDSTGPNDVSEDKQLTNEVPEHQQEPTRELHETADATEPKQDEVQEHSAKATSNTADEQAGDRDPVPAEEDNTTVEPSIHQEQAAQEAPSEAKDIEESKPEHPEDSVAKDDLHGSDHQAETEKPSHEEERPAHGEEKPVHEEDKPSHEEEKPANEPSVHQEESTQEILPESTDLNEGAAAEHSASAPIESERDVSHTEQAPPTQSQPDEDTSSKPETTSVPAHEEQATGHGVLSSEGITKGGAAEEYLKMADAEPDSHQEDNAPTSGAVDNSEPAPSSHEQATSQKDIDSANPTETRDIPNTEVVEEGPGSSPQAHEDTDSASPAETRDIPNDEVVEEGPGSSAQAHEEMPSLEKDEEAPAAAHDETTNIESQPEANPETLKSQEHDADDSAVKDVSHDKHPNETGYQAQHDEPTLNDVDQATDSPNQPQAELQSATKSEAEPQLGDNSEGATHETDKTEPAEGETAVDSHGDSSSPSKDNEKQPLTEQPAQPQTLEQADISTPDGHHEQHQEASSLDHPSEHKNQDNQNSRDLQGGHDQKDSENSVGRAETRALDDSAQPLEDNHPVDQASVSEPKPGEALGIQKPEDSQTKDVGQVLEGSGNDLAPSKGLGDQDSGDHPAEENFDLSGSEPIPGTMTHGKDPEGADKNINDADVVPSDVDEKATNRHPDTEEQGPGGHVSEHQPDVDEHETGATHKTEPEEQPKSDTANSHHQDPASKEGEQSKEGEHRLEKPNEGHEDPNQPLASDIQTSAANHSTETEQPSQNTDFGKGSTNEPNEEHSIAAEDSETPIGQEPPEISVSEEKSEEPHGQDSKQSAVPDGSSSRGLEETGPDSTTAQQSEDAWEDRHKPSTIHTDDLHPDDDDADAGLFAVPPTPREEIDQQKPASVRTASPPQAEANNDSHDASFSLSDQPKESRGAVYGTDTSAHEREAGAERKATDNHDEEDLTSQPPWLAQNEQSEVLPKLQTDSENRDIGAHEASPAHSRDGSYHEDFKLSPVAYTPDSKKSRSIESLDAQGTDENKHTDDHQEHGYGETKPEMSLNAPMEERDDSHQDGPRPGDLHETHDAHVDLAPQHPAEQTSILDGVEQLKDPQEEAPSKDISPEQHLSSTETPHDRSMGGNEWKEGDEIAPIVPQPTSYASEVNYEGEGYGPTPSEEHHYDLGATAYPQSGQNLDSPGLTATSQSEARSVFSGHDTAGFSHSDDRTDTDSHMAETPTMAADFAKDQDTTGVDTSGQFHHALGNLPDESAHTVQGTDDLFEDDDDDSDYGEAIVEPTEKLVYQADGSHENIALGGNHSSLSLGRNSMASQGSYGHHRSAGSRSSFGSVRETTPLRATEGLYLATSPSIVRADWAAAHEEELRQHSRATPQLHPSTTNDTPGISPFALRNTPAGGAIVDDDSRGLSASRWSPHTARPQTPPSTTRQAVAESPRTPGSATRLSTNNPFRAQQNPERHDTEELDPSMYVPRDVTNTPWHARNDSIPMSLHSQTTLSSNQDSPIHSSLPVDRHEPVIRDSWPNPAPGYQQYLSSWGGRPRGDSSLSSNNGDYDPFKADANGSGNVNKSSIYNPFQQRGRAESSVSAAPSAVSASPSRGSGLFHKMRSVFEQGGSGAAEAPPLTRPVSGTYHAISPRRIPSRPEQGEAQEEQAYSNRPGY